MVEKSNCVDADVRLPSTSDEPFETVMVNGNVLVYTDNGIESKETVAFIADTISFVGTNDDARKRIGPRTRVVDLHGKTVMPGIQDGHLHGGDRNVDGLTGSCCDMEYEGGSIDSILSKLRNGLTQPDQLPYLKSQFRFTATNFFGPATLPRGRTLTRMDLDRLSADPSDDEFGTGTARPIVVIDKGCHAVFVNSQALINAEVDVSTKSTSGNIGRDSDGTPNGCFNDYPGEWGPQLPLAPDADYLQRLDDLSEANGMGITSFFEAAGSVSDAAIWARIADDGYLTARVNQGINVTSVVRGNSDPSRIAQLIDELESTKAEYDGYSSPASPGTLAIDTVKVFCDGEAEYPHQTAALLEPYNINEGSMERPEWVPSANYGEDPSCSDAILGFVMLDSRHWNLHLHCLGDRSTRESLDNFDQINSVNSKWDRRHTITHLALVSDADIPRLGELGIVANMSLQWARRDAGSFP